MLAMPIEHLLYTSVDFAILVITEKCFEQNLAIFRYKIDD